MRKIIIRLKQLMCVLFWGIPTTFKLLHFDKETTYFIPHVGIGDYCEALGYLKAYREYYQPKHITVVAMDSRREICGFYTDYDELLILSKRQYIGLVYLASIPFLRILHLKCKRIENVSYTLYMSKHLLFTNPGLHVNSCTKMILKIPSGSKWNAPRVPQVEISSIIEKNKLIRGRTVILNPYTGGVSIKEIEKSVYEELVEKLFMAGFSVITVLGSRDQRAIKGTDGVYTTLAEAWHLAKWCGYVIGTRSGFFDFIQFTGCKIIAIYDYKYKQKDFFSLQLCGVNPTTIELVESNNYSYLVNSIIKNIEVLEHRLEG